VVHLHAWRAVYSIQAAAFCWQHPLRLLSLQGIAALHAALRQAGASPGELAACLRPVDLQAEPHCWYETAEAHGVQAQPAAEPAVDQYEWASSGDEDCATG
jgi:hypothetical protein